jgi:hypothetical protein
MEGNMVRAETLAFVVCLMALSSSNVFGLDEHKQHSGLLRNMGRANITLRQGLNMAESQGQPISGKFELEPRFWLAAGSASHTTPSLASTNCGGPMRLNLNTLGLDERMELAMGEWGRRVVHPLGPDYYRFQRARLHQEELSSICLQQARHTKKL